MIPHCDSTTIVIFGATGDLTHRKLIPMPTSRARWIWIFTTATPSKGCRCPTRMSGGGSTPFGATPRSLARSDEIKLAWKLIDPTIQAWQSDNPPLATYDRDSWGPAEAEALLAPGRACLVAGLRRT